MKEKGDILTEFKNDKENVKRTLKADNSAGKNLIAKQEELAQAGTSGEPDKKTNLDYKISDMATFQEELEKKKKSLRKM